jgi:hypothetical protein
MCYEPLKLLSFNDHESKWLLASPLRSCFQSGGIQRAVRGCLCLCDLSTFCRSSLYSGAWSFRLSPPEVSAFRDRGVPGPTSKLSPRAPAQMGRRETEREGGEGVAEPPKLFQLKCLSPALKARPHLNRNKSSVPRI